METLGETYYLVDKDGMYLNHSTLNSMSGGSKDMAWKTNDLEKAWHYMDKAKEKGKRYAVEVEYC